MILVVGEIPLLNSLGAWVGGFGYTECRWDAGDGVTVISGLNTLGNTSQGSWLTNATSTSGGSGSPHLSANLLFLVFAQTTSSLLVGAGRQLQVVL